MDVETVLFDLDSTLCRHRRSREEMLTEAFDLAGVTPYCTASDLSAVVPDIPAAESYVEFYTLCLEAAAKRKGTETNGERSSAVARAYDSIVDQFDVEFISDAETVLRGLESRYTLGLVTNGGRDPQLGKLDVLGIRNAFDTLVFATPEKGLKPDPYPFECALRELDATPDETVHIGDSLHADVAGANAMGIGSVWIPRGGVGSTDGPTPDHTLDMLSDLPTILNN